jgi:hypothetical protein
VSAATCAVAVDLAEVMNGPVGGFPLAVTVWVIAGAVLSVSLVISDLLAFSGGRHRSGAVVLVGPGLAGNVRQRVGAGVGDHHPPADGVVVMAATQSGVPGSQEALAASVHTWTSTDIRVRIRVSDEIVTLALDGEEVTPGPEGGVPVAVAVLVISVVTSSL